MFRRRAASWARSSAIFIARNVKLFFINCPIIVWMPKPCKVDELGRVLEKVVSSRKFP